MSPLAVLTSIILGSAVALEFSLSTVWFMAFWLRGESRQLDSEIPRLPVYCALLLVLAAIAGNALYSILKKKPWRWWAQGAMWLTVWLTCVICWRGV